MNEYIGVYTSVCEADARWVDQYLAEITRLDLPFAMYFDRCSNGAIDKVLRHPNCVGSHNQPIPDIDYQESHKQPVLDMIQYANKYRWAMSWDIDETFERDAPAKLQAIAKMEAELLTVRWANLWGDKDHVRTDGIFSKNEKVNPCYTRDRFHRLGVGIRWYFIGPFVYAPYALKDGRKSMTITQASGLTCLHWGYMSRELREEHKRRWDHNYGTACGRTNPYGTWEWICDEVTNPPVVERHDFL